MAQQYGLGRGLSSLIPPKKPVTADGSAEAVKSSVVASPFIINPTQHADGSVVAPTPAVPQAQSVPIEGGVVVSKAADPMADLDRDSVVKVPLHKIAPNPEQPRVQFDKEKLAELAQSIQEHGILQPLVVTRAGENYELIAGERRLQASKLAGLAEVPVIIRDANERTKLELAIIENTQRHNLNPIEEAKAYLRLMEEYGLHQEEVAQKMGKSRSVVANTVRLLHLPVEIQRAVIEGKISEGHAKALLAIENPEKQRALFDMILKSGLTVRETEMQARTVSVRTHVRKEAVLTPELSERMERLREKLGTKVKLAQAGKGGRIIIEYYSPEELQEMFQRFGL
jgi:ParB family chromosome partitioning protein